MTQGESNWGQTGSNEVKPAGDSTPARPETAARLGKRPQGTDEAVLGLIGELLQAHVEWWWRLACGDRSRRRRALLRPPEFGWVRG